MQQDAPEDRQRFLELGSGYLVFGDVDKPFHRPECECEDCEQWRTLKGRPTHKEVNEYQNARK